MTTIVLIRKNNEVVVARDGQVSMGNTVIKSTAAKVRKIEKRNVIAGFADIGVSAEILPEELLRELNRVADDILNEEAAKDEDFAEILASQRAFRKSYAQWKSRAYLPRDF